MPLSALFLDVGHTLLRERPSRFEIYARAARDRGLPVDAGTMRTAMATAHETLPLWIDGAYRYSDRWFERFIEHVFVEQLGLEASRLPALTDELFGRFEDRETFAVYPGAMELLESARGAGLVLGVVSNWSARLPRVLEALGLHEAFDFVLTSALEEREKPDPELFRRALARAGVEAGAAAHAGDRVDNDLHPARALGLEAVLVDHDDRTPPSTVTAAGGHHVRDLDQLRRWMLQRVA